MAKNRDSISNEDVSILSSGVKIEGKLYSEGNVRIDGKIKGNVTVNGNLTLGESSEVNGEIKAQNITVNGAVDGKVSASEKLVLEEKSKVHADLVARILVVEEGATFDGKSNMSNGAGVSMNSEE